MSVNSVLHAHSLHIAHVIALLYAIVTIEKIHAKAYLCTLFSPLASMHAGGLKHFNDLQQFSATNIACIALISVINIMFVD